jgi:NAD+ kinase
MDQRRNLYFFYHSSKKLNGMKDELYQLAEKYGFTLVANPDDANIIASVGGDGTFLQAVRKTGFRDDALYVGISNENQTSFYSDFYLNDVDSMVEAMTSEEIEVRRYPVIEVSVDNEDPFYCLNECTIRSSVVKTFVIDVFIDDLHFETFRGDGMIISTPTGSTGYNKSLHGAIVDPLLTSFQVNELASLNNNQYRTLDAPIILSGQRKLTLKVAQEGNSFPIISMDNEAIGTSNIEEIQIQLSEKIVKTVKLKNNSFWQKVQRMFL